jgi:endogenous inhibitor of DNA gyrase (YacG/DUF329 family)
MVYGISQNPNTNDYVIVFQDIYCKKCNEKYTSVSYKWCKPCQIKDLTNWASGDKIIDNFIQQMQMGINDPHDIIFEWIPYNQFNNIKVVNKDNFSTVCSARWMNGPLFWGIIWNDKEYIRESNKKIVIEEYSTNTQNIDKFLNIKAGINFFKFENFFLLQ